MFSSLVVLARSRCVSAQNDEIVVLVSRRQSYDSEG